MTANGHPHPLPTPSPRGKPRQELNLWDSVAIIVGIIVGAGIFETAPTIASLVPHPRWILLLWALGGVISLLGAMCYAELATTYPKEGGDYVYLSRAYGSWLGFLFAWARLSIIQTGSIGMLAYVFGRYATAIRSFGEHSYQIYAAGAVLVLTGLNLLGARQGKWTQNTLTLAKIIGLGGILVLAFGFTQSQLPPTTVSAIPVSSLPLALVLVLWTYGGWNEAAYVAAEVQNPHRNIVRALVLGTSSVMLLYLVTNGAYLYALGLEGLQGTKQVAADVVAQAIGAPSDVTEPPQQDQRALPGHPNPVNRVITAQLPITVMAVLVIISALGAINGEIFTGSRISYAVGTEHRVFALLGRWGRQVNAPIWALVFQGIVAMALVLLAGRHGGSQGFENLMRFTAPVFWLFFLLTGISLFVLRRKDALVKRPFRVPLYPIVPTCFCLSSAFMLYSSIVYAMQGDFSEQWLTAIVAGTILLTGLPLYWFSQWLPARGTEKP